MANNGVNVKMGVEGVAQFKQNMKTAQTAVKTLDEQLKLNEKQFKATGDAEAYMQEKAELLKVRLEEQKAIISNAEKALDQMTKNGVDKASTSYQKMQQELLKAKGELLDTETQLNNIGVAGEEAGDGVDAMNAQLKRVGQGVSWQNVTDGLGKITTGLENVAKKAVSVGKKVVSTMLGAGAWADELQTDATVFGLDVETLQRMQYTANWIDTSVETIINAQKKLRKGIGSADTGVMGAFVELMGKGYDPRQKGWEQAFWDAGEALMKFTNEEQREVYAQKLFGRSWNELIPLFEAGREEYDKMNASWNVLSEEQVKNLGQMDDAYQTLQANVENLKMSLLSEFAEPFAALMTTINDKVGEFTEWLQSDEGKAAVDNVVMTVQQALEWIANPENMNKVIDGLKVIVGGWAALKLTGGALNVLQLINGLRGVTAGGAAAISAAGSAAGSAWAGAFGAAAVAGLMMFPVLKRLFEGETPEQKEANEKVAQINELADEMKKGGAKTASGRDALAALWSVGTSGKTGHEVDTDVLNQQEAEGRNARWMGSMHALDQLQSAAEDLSGRTVQSTSEMTAAANDMKGLPAEVAAAVRDVVASMVIYIDGESVGRAVTPHISAGLGSKLLATTK